MTLRESHSTDPVVDAETQFGLARALTAAGRDPQKAITLATQARNTYAKGAGVRNRERLAEVEAWLKSRRR